MSTRSPRVTTSLLSARTRALRRQLPLAIQGDGRGVHQGRVATRRLREAVPVLARGVPGAKAGKAARILRRLTRALGAVRELDVTIALIDEFAASDDLSRAALQDVRLHVDSERTRRRELMLARLSKVNLDKLDRRLGTVREALEEQPSDAWRQELSARLARRARKLTQRIDAAGHLYAPERLHEVRIAAKKLRYGLELAADAGVAAAVPLVRDLKRLQGILGRLHDLQVLQIHVVAVQVAPSGRTVPHEGLAAIAGRIEEQCRLLHGRYVTAVPSLRTLTTAVRTDIVPRLRRTRQLKMGIRRPVRAAAGGR